MIKKRISLCTFGILMALIMTAFQLPRLTNLDAPIAPIAETYSDSMDTDLSKCFGINTTFQHGEKLTYKLYYRLKFIWLPAGEVVFEVNETDDGQYHLSATGHSYKTYNLFVKVKDRYESFLDKETLLPNSSVKKLEEGKYRLYDKVLFHQSDNKATVLRGETSDAVVETEHAIEGCIHDVLSILYYSRNINFDNFKNGTEFPSKLFVDKEVWPLSVTYRGKVANKKIKGQGRFNTIHLRPGVIAGEVFNANTKMDVWVSDDKNKVPLLIKAPVSVGSVKAVLKNYSGLRHELSAKLK